MLLRTDSTTGILANHNSPTPAFLEVRILKDFAIP
jgi:hypothetical protein